MITPHFSSSVIALGKIPELLKLFCPCRHPGLVDHALYSMEAVGYDKRPFTSLLTHQQIRADVGRSAKPYLPFASGLTHGQHLSYGPLTIRGGFNTTEKGMLQKGYFYRLLN